MKHTLIHFFRSRNRIMFTESSEQNDSVAMILSLIALLLIPLATLDAADRPNIPWITPGELIVERPTLICLGFQWCTSGDDNKNAKATVKFRRVGDTEWKRGLDLWRLNEQRCIGYRGEEHDFYEPPQMFADSLFDLEPDTQYECVLTISDPDGVKGTAEHRVVLRTRRTPRRPADSRVLHVGGAKSDFSDFRTAVDALAPGDTLLVHRGVYPLSRPSDADYLDNHTFTLDLQGTAERPITIKGAGDGEVVFDGQGNYMLFDVQNSQHLILDGLTIRGADFAVYAGGTLPCENQGIVVRDCTYTNIKRSIQGFAVDTERGRSGEASGRTAGRVRHVGGPSEVVDGVPVNPKDGGRVFRSLGNALFGDDRWTQDRCGRSSKRRNDLVRPGDTIIVHRGETLLDHSKKSHWGPCYFYNSTIVLNLKGTPDRPITIHGEGRPVFNGVGNYKIFDVQGSEHLVIEGLHFKNASFAVYKGQQTVQRPVVGLTVRRCRFEDIGCGVYGISGANRDFLISDNVFIGRCNEIYPVTEQNKGRAWAHDEASYSAVHLAGQGHVICHNDVYRFFDGLQMQSNWATSPTVNTYWTAGGDEPVELRTSAVDIYNNILRWTPDNAIEADMAHHNIRIMRNLCVDTFGGYWSNQFVMGGPCYWIRNVAYSGCPHMYKNDAGPVGILSFHNTFIGGRPESWPPRRVNVGPRRFTASSSQVSCGDLILKPGDCAGVLSHPPAIPPRDKKQVPTQYNVDDFMPMEHSSAIDRASDILPNINDEYAGNAPDLGAIEFGKALPHYGPRDPDNLARGR